MFSNVRLFKIYLPHIDTNHHLLWEIDCEYILHRLPCQLMYCNKNVKKNLFWMIYKTIFLTEPDVKIPLNTANTCLCHFRI